MKPSRDELFRFALVVVFVVVLLASIANAPDIREGTDLDVSGDTLLHEVAVNSFVLVATEAPTATSGASDTPTKTPPQSNTNGGVSTDPFDVRRSSVTVMSEHSAMPGDAGTGGATFENIRSQPVTVEIQGIEIDESENGLTEPEAEVDGSIDSGELAEAVDVSISLVPSNGTREFLVGSSNETVSLVSLTNATLSNSVYLDPNESVTVEIYWEIPSSAGDRIQSDEVTVDLIVRMMEA